VAEDARDLQVRVVDAAEFLVPMSVSAKAVIAELRRDATGRFLSASHAGPYRIPTEDHAKHRVIDLEEAEA
jgi:hypothetical protein